MYTLKFTQETILKQAPAQANTLPDKQLYATVSTDRAYPISSWARVHGHIKFSLGLNSDGKQLSFIPSDGQPRNTWYVFEKHAQILKHGQPIEPTPAPAITEPFRWFPRGKQPNHYMLVYPQNKVDQFGGDLFVLARVMQGRIVDQMTVISGAPGKKGTIPQRDRSGSNRPCPEGSFGLGQVEEGNWGGAIGQYWISVFGTSPREAVGIHEDANRAYAPGSAGCVCPLNQNDMIKICSWRKAGADILIVNHGLGTV